MKTAGKLVFLLGLFLLTLGITPTAYGDILFLAEKNNGSVWLWILTILVAAGAILSLLPRKKKKEKTDTKSKDNKEQ